MPQMLCMLQHTVNRGFFLDVFSSFQNVNDFDYRNSNSAVTIFCFVFDVVETKL